MLNSAPSAPLSDELLRCLTFISPNEHEAEDLTGIHIRHHGHEVNMEDTRAPRCSVLAETLILQALSVVLQADADLSPQQYVKWHPGGSLGRLRDNEK